MSESLLAPGAQETRFDSRSFDNSQASGLRRIARTAAALVTTDSAAITSRCKAEQPPCLVRELAHLSIQDEQPKRHAGSANGRYPGLSFQPESSPISQDQLAAEVKAIYAGLVMVETKCIDNIDAARVAGPRPDLDPGQWQALIALHRTLLYEHHDFLMSVLPTTKESPAPAPQIRNVLTTKYSMPARMWKYGIHSFLEFLRRRHPDSQEYMLAFIYLAYQMIALLHETVPSFTDTWIQCLGDLARYRMAVKSDDWNGWQLGIDDLAYSDHQPRTTSPNSVLSRQSTPKDSLFGDEEFIDGTLVDSSLNHRTVL